ncbi:D-alanine--poly(phosphoribitol) ligase subunit DltC [Desulfosporosinus sp. PR]|uniref:D-alanine--poly(phosphoribitol) ligase subunit DltC n=1 Tax=Candidatus Desulfosporosinus nitrosoreducens TaxID=3401928 RepID=UPI0027F83ABE|nr:D-alanine--poly(phosphoribitol) ligase subunit DltC [Desulfosporosinus sp. PR]MDQ7096452.1 D-alanine--poly(phosphoribitol) ligase subunit DltC [Desulfosporosinus sp. PR]
MSNHAIIRPVILTALTEICGTDQVANNPNQDLLANGLLDSFGLVELLLAIHEQLNIDIAPTEMERETWSNPEKIIQYLEEKLK